MPITQQAPISEHIGNGVATVFAYGFAILAADDLKVQVGGVLITTGFTVSGIGERAGGVVTFSAPPAVGATVLLLRQISLARSTDYQYQGDLRSDVLDDDLDRLWMAAQDQRLDISRALMAPVGESIDVLPSSQTRSRRVLGFDAQGRPAAYPLSDAGVSFEVSQVGNLPHDVLPYVRADITPGSTSTFTVAFPDIEAVFDGVQVSLAGWSVAFSPSTITDVWVDSAGALTYESVSLTNWSALPRYADRLHLYRIQTSGIQVTGIFVRANPTVTRDATTFDDLSASSFIRDYVVPTTDYLGYSPWVPGASVQADTFRVSGQNIWVVVKDGVLGAAPADPVYNTSVIGGISNLSDVVSGTATVRFAGKVYLSGAIKQARASGVEWYFGALAAGLLAESDWQASRAFLMRMAQSMCQPWSATKAWVDGNVVCDAPTTGGKAWVATAGGVSASSWAAPAAPAIGDTYTDGTVTWQYMGQINVTAAQRNFWVNMRPDQKECYAADSHDSYAALLAWVAAKVVKASAAQGLGAGYTLDFTVPGTGQTLLNLIKDCVYYNCITQIDATKKLTQVFQGGANPAGGSYTQYFLMDNCEVWAGLESMRWIADAVGDSTYSAYAATSRDTVSLGIRGLYDQTVGAFRFAHGETVPTSGALKYYPWVQCQFWPALWGVPTPSVWTAAAASWSNARYSSWWQRSDIDDLKAYGAHLGLVIASGDPVIRDEVLEAYTQQRRAVSGAPALYAHDAAYLLEMRKPSQQHLTTWPSASVSAAFIGQIVPGIRSETPAGYLLMQDKWIATAEPPGASSTMALSGADAWELYRHAWSVPGVTLGLWTPGLPGSWSPSSRGTSAYADWSAGKGIQLPASGTFVRSWAPGQTIDSGRVEGSYQADAMQGHAHATPYGTAEGDATTTTTNGSGVSGNLSTGGPIDDGVNGAPRVAGETRPKSYAFRHFILYKLPGA